MRLEGQALANIQRADTLGCAEFVAADGEKVDAQLTHADRNAAGRLDAVGVEESAGGTREGGDLAHRLQDAGLIIGVHDGDQGGGGAQRAPDVIHANQAVAADGQPGDFRTFLFQAFAFQMGAGIEHRGVFDGAGNHVLRPARVSHHAENGQVIGLRSAAGEDNFAGVAANARGELTARVFEALLGGLAEMMDTGRVAADLDQGCREVFQHLRRDRGGRVVVEVKMPHFIPV